MAIFKRKNKWWIDIFFDCKRFRLPSPLNTVGGAKAYEATVRHKLALGEPARPVRKKKEKIITFNEFFRRWMSTYVMANNKPAGAVQKESIFKVHLDPFFGKMPLKNINTSSIEIFKSEKRESEISPKTINNILIVLGTCLKAAFEEEIIEKMPILKKLRFQAKAVRSVSEDELQILLNNTTGMLKELILFASKTGVRFGEMIALSWDQVILDDNNPRIVIEKSVSRGILGGTKTNKIRYIPLTNEICELLRSKENKTGLLFPGKKGLYASQSTFIHELHKACDRAGIKRTGFHGFRHGFCSSLSEAGVPLMDMRDLMGHSSYAMLSRYTHASPESLQHAIRLLDAKKVA